MTAEELYKSGNMPEMTKHWYSIRQKYPETYLLAYRMGDFYEFFYNDAVNVSKLLGLTLTKRGSGPSRHPLAGIPHKATQHFKSLVSLGQTVIIVEQLESPSEAKKDKRIVKRGVVRILSPGTIVDDDLLDSKNSNYICTIHREKRNYAVAFLDISSADFFTSEFYGKNALVSMWAFIVKYSPVECVLSTDLLSDFAFMSQLRENIPCITKEHAPHNYNFNSALSLLLTQFNVKNLTPFDIEDKILSVCASGGLLSFVKDAQIQETTDNIKRIKYIQDESFMFLDINTQKNLELLRNQNDGGTFGTLFDILDHTQTPMGTRLLKSWIVQPLIDKNKIEERLNLVQYFVEDFDIRQSLRNKLSQIGDLSRLISRINYSSTVNARNLLQIQNGLEIINEIREIFVNTNSALITPLIENLTNFSQLIELIQNSIHEMPPTTITEGGIIKRGYNAQVDEYHDILDSGKDWILKFEAEEKQKLGISAGIKIGYNRVIGYYIQITENALKSVVIPEDYIQRQSIKNGIRYETNRLKEMEEKILSADENVKDLEYSLFQEIRERVKEDTLAIQLNADIIANLDVLSNFAENAQNFTYTKPKIETHKKILIKGGRHPVVEQINTSEQFVPNDNLMDTDQEQILIITGPNWSGKSTYLRQNALLVLMGQIGSYIPCDSAEIGIVDRIFTRIGASDDLSRGQSTFMLEMNEMAQILNYSTERSLIIIDELGRGTGTLDGESIAQAVLEYLHDFQVKTLFSTHFHQLINLQMPRIHNYHFKIIEKTDTRKLVFLRQLTDGGTDKSYGIHVAEMAGLPARVIERAFFLMEEAQDLAELTALGLNSREETPTPKKQVALPQVKPIILPKTKKKIQTSLFPIKRYDDSELVLLLRSLDLEKMTPVEAFETLVKLKKKVKSGAK